MPALLVFDDSFTPTGLPVPDLRTDRVDLFPLTGNWRLVREVHRSLERAGVPVGEIVDTARLVEAETEILDGRLGEWSARVGRKEIDGRTVRESLLSPDGGVSSYWFGAVSERNPLKTDLFLRLAQANALQSRLTTCDYKACFVGLEDRYLRETVRQLGLRHQTLVIVLRSRRAVRDLGSQLRLWCEQGSFFGQLVLGMGAWIRFLYWRFLVGRAELQNSLISPERDQLLFVTYFPYLDLEAARSGRFHNLYAGPLHELFQQIGREVVWLLVYVKIDDKSFREAVALKRRLASEGECLYFIEEFLPYRLMIRAFVTWVRQIRRGRWLERRLSGEVLCEGLSEPTCSPIIRQLWWKSFAGPDGVQGLLYYEAFKSAFASFPGSRQCLYYCEMQGWEMALNAAARKINPRLKTVGYQHTAISRYFFPYFPSPSDVIHKTGRATDLPIPDVLACNGNVGRRLLSRVGYPQLVTVEAVRQVHLRPVLKRVTAPREGQPTFLVAGSIVRRETEAMLSLLSAALPRSDGLQIWLKGHPSLPLEEVLDALGIDLVQAGYQIKYGNIGDHLGSAWGVLVSTSTVAVEALAYGCEVIVPCVSTSLPLSPVVGSERYYHRVYTPEDLQEVVKNVAAGKCKVGVEEKRSFVGDYWCLDPTLSRWSALLTEPTMQRAREGSRSASSTA